MVAPERLSVVVRAKMSKEEEVWEAVELARDNFKVAVQVFLNSRCYANYREVCHTANILLEASDEMKQVERDKD